MRRRGVSTGSQNRPPGRDGRRSRAAHRASIRCRRRSMPGSPSTNIEMMSSANDAGSSQNEILFMRGNAMSGAPIMSGTIQLPKPPISAGISTKKIMMRP